MEVEKLVTHLLIICDYESSGYSDKSVTYVKGLRETITFILKVRGVNILTCTQKSRNYVTDSTVPVTIVPRMISQEPD